jgi:hypothetical protein
MFWVYFWNLPKCGWLAENGRATKTCWAAIFSHVLSFEGKRQPVALRIGENDVRY